MKKAALGTFLLGAAIGTFTTLWLKRYTQTKGLPKKIKRSQGEYYAYDSTREKFYKIEAQEFKELIASDNYTQAPDQKAGETIYIVKILEKGGEVVGYIDLSERQPDFVNEQNFPESNIKEVDLVKVGVNTIHQNKKIHSSKNAYDIFTEIWGNDINIRENMYILFLNKSNTVIAWHHLSKGGIDGTVADIELICAIAIKTLSKGIVLAHNHPSGNLKPSEQDIKLTRTLNTGLKIYGISVVDHLIVTDNGYYSFADEGVSFEKGGKVYDAKTQEQITKLEKAIASPATPNNFKEVMKKKLAILKSRKPVTAEQTQKTEKEKQEKIKQALKELELSSENIEACQKVINEHRKAQRAAAGPQPKKKRITLFKEKMESVTGYLSKQVKDDEKAQTKIKNLTEKYIVSVGLVIFGSDAKGFAPAKVKEMVEEKFAKKMEGGGEINLVGVEE